jgi:hypothetical protein
MVHLTVEKALRFYQKFMDAVDCCDQYCECGGGFARKSHYKKWYKKTYFAVLDVMLLNVLFAWNMSAKGNPELGRLQVKKAQFYAAVAEEMIAFSNEDNQFYGSKPSGVGAQVCASCCVREAPLYGMSDRGRMEEEGQEEGHQNEELLDTEGHGYVLL